jgi:hypothetical protein
MYLTTAQNPTPKPTTVNIGAIQFMFASRKNSWNNILNLNQGKINMKSINEYQQIMALTYQTIYRLKNLKISLDYMHADQT